MNKNRESDEWLMGQVAGGRRECLTPLVRRFANPLLTFIQRMTGDRHQSEELFQEVFLTVWLKRGQYRFPRSFKSWLFAIAANRCRQEHRRSRPLAAGLDDDALTAPSAGDPTPVEAAISTEIAAHVAVAVANLPAQQRSVVVMRIYNEFSYTNIADVLDCSEATVRSHMHHALTAMRKHLESRI